jgi:hypothetical protein
VNNLQSTNQRLRNIEKENYNHKQEEHRLDSVPVGEKIN